MVSAPYGEAKGGNGTELRRVISETTNVLATGVIYTCRLTPSACEGLIGNGNEYDKRLYDRDGWYSLMFVYST